MVQHITYVTAQKMKFSIKDFFSKCEQIRSFLRKTSFFCAVCVCVKFRRRCQNKKMVTSKVESVCKSWR